MHKDRLPCTAYSCQVMASTQARDAAERARLSKAAVVEQALALGDAEGLEALTYRRLAQQLGVTPMALSRNITWILPSRPSRRSARSTGCWDSERRNCSPRPVPDAG